MENERAHAGQDGRTCLARPISPGANGDKGKFIFLVQLTTTLPCSAGQKDWQLHRFIHTLPDVRTIHTECVSVVFRRLIGLHKCTVRLSILSRSASNHVPYHVSAYSINSTVVNTVLLVVVS